MSTRKLKTNQNAKESSSLKISSKHFPIVGIGASAGGLEALEQFFGNLPEETGMAFVVIQHLDPNHAGMLPELLQRFTGMKVLQASDGLRVKVNCLYVIPANKSLSLLKGVLHLFDPVESRGLRLPVDIFFRSLAEDMQDKSIGIILSGMGSDGTQGLKAIKEKNGLVLVQDPLTAKFDGMPVHAIEAVMADIVAPADELPEKLLALLKVSPKVKTDQGIRGNNTSNLDKIIILLRDRTGHDFSLYKKKTLFRRIERRINVHQIENIHTYVNFLQENPAEVEILFKELLIGVTSFFRDNEVWEYLKEQVLPEMINKLPEGYEIRAWVPGCSTGEEAYTLAIVLREALGKVNSNRSLRFQIFATDLDNDAIEKARKGIFSKNIAADLSPARLKQFFTIENGGYRVKTMIREMIIFATQNVIKDPPFTRLDLLSCRNLMIYMGPELQQQMINLFHYSLHPGGILLLGNSESLGNFKGGFEELERRFKIFIQHAASISPAVINFPKSFHLNKAVAMGSTGSPKSVENIQVLADQILLQRFSPASVLVNNKGDILYNAGRTGKYLEPAAGKANWNIYMMAREGLRQALPGAFRKAILTYEQIVLHSIRVVTDGSTQLVDVTIQQIEHPAALKGTVIVVFTDVPKTGDQLPISRKNGKTISNTRLKELQTELLRSYEDLQSTREEMQTSQEELKSTNEELQSTNEELQSTNEELTTSKEEMQSLNEELQTINAELQSKVNDFALAHNDMKNLLNSTEIATLFLDKELNIRRFTDQATNIIKLRTTDIGRPFTDLVTDLQYPKIDEHARQVIKTLIPVETAITTNDKRWFLVRIIPYRTLDDRIDGLVLTFSNITVIKQAQEALTASEARYRNLFDSAKDGILILDAETGLILDVNQFLTELLGYSREQIIEKTIWEIGFLKDLVTNKTKFSELLEKEYIRYSGLPLETVNGNKINVEFISNVYYINSSKVIQCIIRDMGNRLITEDSHNQPEDKRF